MYHKISSRITRTVALKLLIILVFAVQDFNVRRPADADGGTTFAQIIHLHAGGDLRKARILAFVRPGDHLASI